MSKRKGKGKKCLWLVIAFLLVPVSAFAQTLQFQWDAHPTPTQIDGFKLYQATIAGQPGTLVATFTGGALVTGTIPRPPVGQWFYTLTAYKAAIESDRSNEVSYVVKPATPNLGPIVERVAQGLEKAKEGLAESSAALRELAAAIDGAPAQAGLRLIVRD